MKPELVIGQHYTVAIKNVVEAETRAAYNVFVRSYPGILPLWVLGFEKAPANKEKLIRLITEKAEASGNIPQFLLDFCKAIENAPKS